MAANLPRVLFLNWGGTWMMTPQERKENGKTEVVLVPEDLPDDVAPIVQRARQVVGEVHHSSDQGAPRGVRSARGDATRPCGRTRRPAPGFHWRAACSRAAT